MDGINFQMPGMRQLAGQAITEPFKNRRFAAGSAALVVSLVALAVIAPMSAMNPIAYGSLMIGFTGVATAGIAAVSPLKKGKPSKTLIVGMLAGALVITFSALSMAGLVKTAAVSSTFFAAYGLALPIMCSLGLFSIAHPIYRRLSRGENAGGEEGTAPQSSMEVAAEVAQNPAAARVIYKQVDGQFDAMIGPFIEMVKNTGEDQLGNMLATNEQVGQMKGLMRGYFGARPERLAQVKAQLNDETKFAQLESWLVN